MDGDFGTDRSVILEFSERVSADGFVRPRPLRSDLLRVAPDFVVLWDMVVIALTGCATAFFSDAVASSPLPAEFFLEACRISLVGALLSPIVLLDRGARKQPGLAGLAEIASRTLRQGAVLIGLLVTVGFLTKTSQAVPRSWGAIWVAAAFTCLVAGRCLYWYWMRGMLQRGLLSERVVLLGDGPVADQIAHRIASGRGGLRLVKMFDNPTQHGNAISDFTMARVIAMGQRGAIDRVILTSPDMDERFVADLVMRLKVLDVEVGYCPALLGAAGIKNIDQVAGVPMVVLTDRPIGPWGSVLKGLFDRAVAGVAIVLLAPLLVGLAIAVRLDSPGPVIFRQRRHGWNGTEFQISKFRTMRVAAHPSSGNGQVQTLRGDARITRVGRFLRSSSLDELPQLFNVLNGTMSLVGPRPHPVVMRTEQRLCEEIIAEYSHRHRVKPGITGWAQVNGHRGATETVEQVRKRVEHDIYYIDNWSLPLDIMILLLTPYRVIFSRQNSF